MVLTIRPHILWMQIIKTDHLDNLDPLDHLYQEDRYRICIAYFVLFQIILIYVQVLLSITLLEQRSDAVYAIFLGWLC